MRGLNMDIVKETFKKSKEARLKIFRGNEKSHI
jgi:hypothetical protein